jgi:Icc-related predicted phosphoesterase
MPAITLISDTHGAHQSLSLTGGDILIHAGDLCNRGTESEVLRFLNWYSIQDYTHKIFIAGNHDFYFEQNRTEDIMELIPSNVTYLNDSGVEIDGIKIWGSPITPTFFNWAFNRDRGESIKKHWDHIPTDTDILITHGPPNETLDAVNNNSVGCEDLRDRIKLIKPKIHVFGHIHEGYGYVHKAGTDYYNAAMMTSRYDMDNVPIDIDYYY